MTSSQIGSDRSAAEVEAEAAEWVCRVDEHASHEEWAALDVWLAANPRHRTAFLRLSRAWRRADELKKLAPLASTEGVDLLDSSRWNVEFAAQESEVEAQAPSRRFSRLRKNAVSRLVAAAAIFAVVTAGAIGVWYARDTARVEVYSTQVGEFKRIALSDRSFVGLNTDTEVRVRYDDDSRHVYLVRGEALFTVANDAERPFDVVAGEVIVRAVGTEFSVRKYDVTADERVEVMVAEGKIAINPPSVETYAAGTIATVRHGKVSARTAGIGEIRARLAWTTGQLIFGGDPLRDVVAEINRYNRRKLKIVDPDVAGLTIGGTFDATDPDGFARALERLFPIKPQVVAGPMGDDVIQLDSGVP